MNITRYQATCKLCGETSPFVPEQIDLADFTSTHTSTAHRETVPCFLGGDNEVVEAYYKVEEVELQPLETAQA